MTPKMALQDAVDKAGGQAALSRALGVRQSHVWYWLKRSRRGVSGEYVLPIEATTGISRSELRPDLYPLEPLSIEAAE